MADIQKFKHSEVLKILKHNLREGQQNSNPDVDLNKSHLNYEISIWGKELKPLDRYLKRKSEVYCYNRNDINTLASWVISAPKELESDQDVKIFFENCVDFLNERYGKENAILAVVHLDEGVKVEKKDRWGNLIKNEDGSIKYETVGRPHLHYNFIPVIKTDKRPEGKISYKERIPLKEYFNFHPDLQKYLLSKGDKGANYVVSGVTRRNGRNYSIKELKDKTKNQNINIDIEKEVRKW